MIPYTLYSLFLKFLWKFLITFILTLKGGNIQSVYKSRIPAQQLSRGKTNNKVVSGEITIEIAERKNEILSRIENCIVDKSTRYFFQMIILYKMQSNWWEKKINKATTRFAFVKWGKWFYVGTNPVHLSCILYSCFPLLAFAINHKGNNLIMISNNIFLL